MYSVLSLRCHESVFWLQFLYLLNQAIIPPLATSEPRRATVVRTSYSVWAVWACSISFNPLNNITRNELLISPLDRCRNRFMEGMWLPLGLTDRYTWHSQESLTFAKFPQSFQGWSWWGSICPLDSRYCCGCREPWEDPSIVPTKLSPSSQGASLLSPVELVLPCYV